MLFYILSDFAAKTFVLRILVAALRRLALLRLDAPFHWSVPDQAFEYTKHTGKV